MIQQEICQGERTGWFTRLVDGIVTPREALSKGIVRLKGEPEGVTLILSYYALDDAGEDLRAFVRGNYLIVPDGLNDGVIHDPIWLNRWRDACAADAPTSGASSGGGCDAGMAGLLSLLFVSSPPLSRIGKKRR